MRLEDCNNFADFRTLARRRVPRAVFDYIDGGADDEVSKLRPAWALGYLRNPRIALPQLDAHVDLGGSVMTISRCFTEMLDPEMNWNAVAEMVSDWGGPFCLKGVMAAEDALRAAEIGCSGVILSNHSGRQLDGTRAPFDQLSEVVDTAGHRLDILVDGGFTRGNHVLKALSLGAKGRGAGVLPVRWPQRGVRGWSGRWR